MTQDDLIDNQERYDLELKWFEDEMKKIMTLNIANVRNPIAVYNKFILALDRAEIIGLFSHKYCQDLRQRIVDGTKDPFMKEKVKKLWGKYGKF